MVATIGRARVTIYMDESFSLKDKRREVRSVCDRVRHKFNAGVSEIEDLDDIRVATIGIVVLSNAKPHADQMLQKILDFIDRSLDLGVLGEVETDLFPFDA